MSKDDTERGFLRGLQSYGDRDFSIYMRRAFAKSMGYSADELARPVVGIANTASRFNPVIEKKKELDAASKAGDKAKVAELMAWGEDYQRRLHFKGFARVPVDDLLEPVKAGMTEVARAQRLDLIAESCDHVGDRVETVDVTDALVALFDPDEKTLATVAQVKKTAPVNLDELDKKRP